MEAPPRIELGDEGFADLCLTACLLYTSLLRHVAVRTPEILLPPVWPLSLSLATTREISVDFFSSAYLDVSVPVSYTHLDVYKRQVFSALEIDRFAVNSASLQSKLAM